MTILILLCRNRSGRGQGERRGRGREEPTRWERDEGSGERKEERGGRERRMREVVAGIPEIRVFIYVHSKLQEELGSHSESHRLQKSCD